MVTLEEMETLEHQEELAQPEHQVSLELLEGQEHLVSLEDLAQLELLDELEHLEETVNYFCENDD